jgi:hypothetical protein
MLSNCFVSLLQTMYSIQSRILNSLCSGSASIAVIHFTTCLDNPIERTLISNVYRNTLTISHSLKIEETAKGIRISVHIEGLGSGVFLIMGFSRHEGLIDYSQLF